MRKTTKRLSWAEKVAMAAKGEELFSAWLEAVLGTAEEERVAREAYHAFLDGR